MVVDAVKCAHNCNLCEIIAISRNSNSLKLYERLRIDNNYTDVEYDERSGGLKATHVDHNFDPNKGFYEKRVQSIGFREGNSVILGKERSSKIGEKFTDGLWNGRKFEIAGAETATKNNIKKALLHCASKQNTEIAVVYFPNIQPENGVINDAVAMYSGLVRLEKPGAYKFEKVVFVFKDGRIEEMEPV